MLYYVFTGLYEWIQIWSVFEHMPKPCCQRTSCNNILPVNSYFKINKDQLALLKERS